MWLRFGSKQRGRSWWRSAGPIVLAIVSLVAVGFTVPVARGLLDNEPDEPDRLIRGDPWERLPRPPANDVLRGPDQGSAFWTGKELLLLPAAGTPFAYDPRSNRWRPLAKAPVPGRASPLTVWTGDRAIFIGGMNLGERVRMDRGNLVAITEQGAAYHPAGLRSGG